MDKVNKVVKHYDDRVETYNEDGKLHSFEDEASVKFNSGRCEHHNNGVLHRIGDKPAAYGSDFKKWMQHGVIHRKGGPALINLLGEFYYLKGTEVSKEEAMGIAPMKSAAFNIAMKHDFSREEAIELIKYLGTKL